MRGCPPSSGTTNSYACPVCDQGSASTPRSAAELHFVPCEESPHVEEEEGWYSCQYSSCPYPLQHGVKCAGKGCDVLIPVSVLLKAVPLETAIPEGYQGHTYTCQQAVASGGNLCNQVAYTCQSPRCPNDGNHLVAATCGKPGHQEKKRLSGMSGDGHREINQQGPITRTYSYGETVHTVRCTKESQYACDPGHSVHVFPEIITNPITDPDPDPTNPPDDGDDGEDPPSEDPILCARNGCDDEVADENEHQLTCPEGHDYWSCWGADASIHGPQTCTRCGASYTKCNNPAGSCDGNRRHTHR